MAIEIFMHFNKHHNSVFQNQYQYENTKNIYPPLSDQFNEDTIYRAFIVFCKFILIFLEIFH